jgi:polyisoprenoid-binding protein YceI
MKKILNFLTLLILGLGVVACQGGETTTSETANETVEVTTDFSGSADFMVDPRFSEISWKATELGIGGHSGKILLQNGSLKVKDGDLLGGKVTINMASITSTDLEGESKGKLERHFKNEDFFAVETYPTASFEIASIVPADTISGASHMVTGNLQIKDITKAVKFPANVRIAGDAVLATSMPFIINRTDWGVNYRSGIMGTLKDKIIDDEVKLTIKVRALLPNEVQ